MSTPHDSGPSIPIVLAPSAAGTLERPRPEERDGIGALNTERGNLPLESLDVAIATTGLAVRTELTQGFRNPYDEPLEATYIFPLPARSAVTSMVLRAADRTIRGELKERAQARQDYDQAISEGKRASIAEEERPGVFTMRVGNILPGEQVTVTLTLAGTMPYEDGEATIRFPLVVAPRYVPGAPIDGGDVGGGVQPDTDAVPDASRITPPVLLPGFPNPVRLSVTADIDPAGLPIEQAVSSLHPVETEQHDHRLWVRVHPGERADRDFVLRLRLGDPDAISSALTLVPDATGTDAADAPETGPDPETGAAAGSEAAASEPAASEFETGTFALTLLPPRQVLPPAARDVVFVLDRSGSMRGWKMVAARRATARVLDTLTPKDRFAVLTFDNVVETPTDLPAGLVPATDRDRFRAIEHLAAISARGGTEMLEPLLRATELLANAPAPADGADGPRERVLVLITDGQVGNEDQILSELSDRFGGLRVHTVGIDRAVNEAFLGRLAMLGGGRTELVESEDRLDAAMDAIHRRIGTPVLTDLELHPVGLDLDTDAIAPAVLPALYAGTALTVHGRYRRSAGADVRGAIRVLGRTGSRPRAEKLTATIGDNPAMAAVWARARLRDLEDRYVAIRGADKAALESLERQITELSLRYGVLCRFTAYVAVDTRVVTDGGAPRRVTQPVDLPQGWELPPEAGPTTVPGAGATGSGMFRTASAALGAPQVQAARAPRAAAESFPAGGIRSRRSMVDGMTGGVAGGIRRGGRRGHWAPPAVDPVVRAEAARLLDQMRAVEPDDRYRWLTDAVEAFRRLAELLADRADTAEAAVIEALRRDLGAFLDGADADPYRTERLWLRVTDVLGALAGDATDGGTAAAPSTGSPSGPQRGGQGSTDQGRGNQGRSDEGRPGRPFWRRSSDG